MRVRNRQAEATVDGFYVMATFVDLVGSSVLPIVAERQREFESAAVGGASGKTFRLASVSLLF